MLVIVMAGCGAESEQKVTVKEAYVGKNGAYFLMSDDTWEYEDYSYAYCLELTGKLDDSTRNWTYTCLSNIEDVTFEQVVEYLLQKRTFKPEELALVDISYYDDISYDDCE